METLILLTPLLFGLSFLSGMLGLGVAFIAIPSSALFGYDLKDVIQPWALLLNGLTAISGAIAFWRAGMVDRRGALFLVAITTVGAPIGVWLLQFASTDVVWWLYVAVLVFLALRMLLPKGAATEVVSEIDDGREDASQPGGRSDQRVCGLPWRGTRLPAHADLDAGGLLGTVGGRDELCGGDPAVLLGLRLPPRVGPLRLGDRGGHFGCRGHRRLARCPVHRRQGQERHPFAPVRGRPRGARSAASVDPGWMGGGKKRRVPMSIELPVLPNLRMDLPAPNVAPCDRGRHPPGRPTRAGILALLRIGPHCVCEMAAALGERRTTSATISRACARPGSSGQPPWGRRPSGLLRARRGGLRGGTRRARELLERR